MTGRNRQISERQYAAEEGINLCNTYIATLEKCLRRMVSIRENLEVERENLPNSGQENTGEIMSLLDQICIASRRNMHRLYQISAENYLTDAFHVCPIDSERIIYEYLDKAIDEITAECDGTVVFLRCPILENRKKLFGKNEETAMQIYHGSSVIQNGIIAAIDRLIEKNEFDPSLYEKKTVMYLFSHGNRKNNFPDNDNYETGSATNGIVCRTFGGDSPTNCRIIYETADVNQLPEGTYITLLPYDEPIPDRQKIIDFWKNKTIDTGNSRLS